MRRTERVTREVEITTEVICNKCCVKTTGNCLAAEYKAAYGSDFDGMQYTFDLCEKCLFALFETFKIPVSIKDCPPWMNS